MSRERPVAWGRRVLVFLARCCLCGYWRVVGGGLFLLPFLLLPVFSWTGEAEGGGVGRVFSFFFLRKGVWSLWLGFMSA